MQSLRLVRLGLVLTLDPFPPPPPHPHVARKDHRTGTSMFSTQIRVRSFFFYVTGVGWGCSFCGCALATRGSFRRDGCHFRGPHSRLRSVEKRQPISHDFKASFVWSCLLRQVQSRSRTHTIVENLDEGSETFASQIGSRLMPGNRKRVNCSKVHRADAQRVSSAGCKRGQTALKKKQSSSCLAARSPINGVALQVRPRGASGQFSHVSEVHRCPTTCPQLIVNAVRSIRLFGEQNENLELVISLCFQLGQTELPPSMWLTLSLTASSSSTSGARTGASVGVLALHAISRGCGLGPQPID